MITRTHLRFNYAQLQNAKAQIDRYYDSIENLEIAMTELVNLLEEQESEAISRLLERISDVKIEADGKKAFLSDLSNIIGKQAKNQLKRDRMEQNRDSIASKKI